jgi:integrase
MAAAPTIRKRPRGYGSISYIAGRPKPYIANYRRLEDGKPDRQAVATEDEAHIFLDRWHAAKVEAQVAAARGDSAQGLARVPARERTFGDAITAHRAERAQTVRDSTLRNYGPAWDALDHYMGHRPVSEITRELLLGYRRARQAGKDWTSEARAKDETDVPPLANSTINQHVDRAREVLDWAIERGWRRGPNPASDLGGKLNVDPYEPEVIREAEIERLIAAAPDDHRLGFLLMGHLALRWGEAYGLGERGVGDGRVFVIQQLYEDRKDRYRLKVVRYLKRSRSRRRLRATRDVQATIDAALKRLADRPNNHPVLATVRAGTPRPVGQTSLLSTLSNANPVRYSNWQRDVWQPTVEAVFGEGFPLTPHGLRHSRLALLAASGRVTPWQLSRFAGHSDPGFTARRYADWFSEAGIDVFAEFEDDDEEATVTDEGGDLDEEPGPDDIEDVVG